MYRDRVWLFARLYARLNPPIRNLSKIGLGMTGATDRSACSKRETAAEDALERMIFGVVPPFYESQEA